MVDVGVLGLDTSHATSFADALADTDGATVAAVWDRGDVREDAYVRSFCEEYGARRYADPVEMVEAVDAAMVLTVDWETHVPLAEPFLDAGVPTLVDKPLAGSLDALDRLEAAAGDTPLFGGSAVPFHLPMANLPRGGTDRTLYAAGYNDFFYYRVHLIDTVRFLADARWEAVEPTAGPGTTIRVPFESGMHAVARYDGGREDGIFGVLDVTDRTRTVEVQSDEATLARLYDHYVGAFLDAVEGRRNDTTRVLDAARLGLAVEVALDEGRRVTPDSEALADVYIDSDAFVADYEPYY